MTKTIVFVHSYCLNGSEVDKRLRLTTMAAEAMKTGIETMKKVGATDILVSAAYETWKNEFQLQKEYGTKQGLSEKKIHAIAPIRDSYEEAQRAVTESMALGASRLVVVSEKWHARRSEMIFRAICPSGLQIEMVRFESSRFEVTLEPSMLKSLRTGFKTTWILWNKLFEFLTPTIIKMKS